jgi:hypothetical protein
VSGRTAGADDLRDYCKKAKFAVFGLFLTIFRLLGFDDPASLT